MYSAFETWWHTVTHGRGIWRMEYSHTTSEHGVSSIISADTYNSAASSRLNWNSCQFKLTRPFRRKTKSGFCVCTIMFHALYISTYDTWTYVYAHTEKGTQIYNSITDTQYCYNTCLQDITVNMSVSTPPIHIGPAHTLCTSHSFPTSVPDTADWFRRHAQELTFWHYKLVCSNDHLFILSYKKYNKFSLWLYCWRCRITLP